MNKFEWVYRIDRNGNADYINFIEMTDEERKAIMEHRSSEWLIDCCLKLANRLSTDESYIRRLQKLVG